MKPNKTKQTLQVRNYYISNLPWVFSLCGLFCDFLPTYLRYFLAWLGPETIAIIAVSRKEIPRLPPFSSITGRSALIRSGIFLFFWTIVGLGWLLSIIFES